MHTSYTLSEDLAEDLEHFFQYQDPMSFKENLRKLFIDYLDYELRAGMPLYLHDMFDPFNSLLNILDKAGKEFQAYHRQPDEQAPATAQEKVISFIKASIKPGKIFLLHHHVTENNKEHFDLLVVVPATATHSFSHYEKVLSMADMENITIDVSLHKPDVLQQQLAEGHLYYNLVCRKDKLLYSNGEPDFLYPAKETLQAMTTNTQEQFAKAYAKAGDFLEGASKYYGENNQPMTAFMLQQAMELTLRGLITAMPGHCAKTHNLKDLKKSLKRCWPELPFLLSADAEEEEHLLHILEKAYLDARYTDAFSITGHETDRLTETGKIFYQQAKNLFNEKLKAFAG